jgi:hypothetical protein
MYIEHDPSLYKINYNNYIKRRFVSLAWMSGKPYIPRFKIQGDILKVIEVQPILI